MRQICCVYGCHLGSKDGVSLHYFPKLNEFVIIKNGNEKRKQSRRKLWEALLKMGKQTPKYARVCSAHFSPQDFFSFTRETGTCRRISRLKNTAVPSRNLPKSSVHGSPRKVRKSPTKRKSRIESLQFPSAEEENTLPPCGIEREAESPIELLKRDEAIHRRRLKLGTLPSQNLPGGTVYRRKRQLEQLDEDKKRKDAVLPTSSERCSVRGCYLGPGDGVSLHLFPRPSETIVATNGLNKEKCNRRKLWQDNLKMRNVKTDALVCSNHFEESDFFPVTYNSAGVQNVKRLKKSAVPSKNLTNSNRQTLPKTSTHDNSKTNGRLRNIRVAEVADEMNVKRTVNSNIDNKSPLELLLKAADIVVAQENRRAQAIKASSLAKDHNYFSPQNDSDKEKTLPVISRLRASPIFFEGRRCIKL